MEWKTETIYYTPKLPKPFHRATHRQMWKAKQKKSRTILKKEKGIPPRSKHTGYPALTE